MASVHLIDDLFSYNDWANAKILGLCQGLSEEELDRPRAMGFGTLRATLFHILTAERVWLERWTLQPWRPFPTDPQGSSLAEIDAGLKEIAASRREFLDAYRSNDWQQSIQFEDSKRTKYDHPLRDLLLHVANHGIHHRAQALSFLKSLGRTVPAGIDYIFYRLAHTTVEQTPASVQALRAFGLGCAEAPGEDLRWCPATFQRLFAYHDWANAEVLAMAAQANEAALDQNYSIGPGTIRQTLLHLLNVELWWYLNWTTEGAKFPKTPPETELSTLASQFKDVAAPRNEFIARLDDPQAQRVMPVVVGGIETRYRVIETVAQVICHGTHHRAQLINMLRSSGVSVKNIDLLYALKDPRLS